MATKETYIGNSKILGKPKKPFVFKLSEKVRGILADLQNQIDSNKEDLQEKMENMVSDLQNQIDSLELQHAAVSNNFGNDEHIGISQKSLTAFAEAMMKKLSEITGEPMGVNIAITPGYFISENGCDVHVTADSGNDYMEKVELFIDDMENPVKVWRDEKQIDYHTAIDKTSVIKCIVTVYGMKFEEQRTIVKHFPFFIGCAKRWEDIVNVDNARPFDGSVHGNYDIQVNQGDRIFIIIPSSQKGEFNRADMNGFEIPMESMEEDGYVIYTSLNTYRAGMYNIDIV